MDDDRKIAPQVYDVPEAGAMVGLSRSASYEAAAKKQIPTIRFGRLLKVPKARWDRIVAGEQLDGDKKPEAA